MDVFASFVLGVFIVYVFWEFSNVYRQIGICLDFISEVLRDEPPNPPRAEE